MKTKKPSAKHLELFQQTQFLHQSGRLAEAAALYQKLLRDFPKDPQLLAALGTLFIQLGDFSQGAILLGRSLKIFPAQANTHFNHGIALTNLNRLEEAVASFDKAIALQPDYAEAYNNRGNTLQALKRFAAAVDSYNTGIALKPNYPEAYNNRGYALQELQQYAAAEASFQQAIQLRPDYAEAYNNLGILHHQLKQFTQALAAYDSALTLKPNYANAHYNRGITLHEMQALEQALQAFETAIALKPDYAAAYNNHGNVLEDMGDVPAALASYTQAIALNANYAKAYFNCGNAQKKLEQLNAALHSYNKALTLNPSHAEAYHNRALVLHDLHQFAAAQNDLLQAVTLNPDYPEAYNSLGNVQQILKNFTAAIDSYDQAIALKPDYAEACWNKSALKILTGEFEAGWQLYEWRWRDQLKPYVRDFTQPLWLGDSDLAGQTLLIYPEQGYGDFIQFCRYLPMLEKIAAHIVLETPPALMTLISSLQGRFTLLEQNSPLPAFDRQCPIMSLPLAFRTSVATIPATTPYLFADPEKLQLWQQKLGEKTGLRIGLAWSGSNAHKNDRNRSIGLAQLAPLLELPFEFHCLQKDLRNADAEFLENCKQLQIHQTDLHDFSDTAALIESLDLVISVDTSVAHLAGALGKAVWILLPFVPDYRWLLDRADSPWYPSATLFRQPAFGDWLPVIAEIRERLQNYQA